MIGVLFGRASGWTFLKKGCSEIGWQLIFCLKKVGKSYNLSDSFVD